MVSSSGLVLHRLRISILPWRKRFLVDISQTADLALRAGTCTLMARTTMPTRTVPNHLKCKARLLHQMDCYLSPRTLMDHSHHQSSILHLLNSLMDSKMGLPMRQRHPPGPQPNLTLLLLNRLNHNYLPSRTLRLHQGCTFPGVTILLNQSLRLVLSRLRPPHHTLARRTLHQLKSYQGQCGTPVPCHMSQVQVCLFLLAYPCRLPSQVSASPSRRV